MISSMNLHITYTTLCHNRVVHQDSAIVANYQQQIMITRHDYMMQVSCVYHADEKLLGKQETS